MHINKKIKNTAFLAVFSIFCAASLSAYQINITVNDREGARVPARRRKGYCKKF